MKPLKYSKILLMISLIIIGLNACGKDDGNPTEVNATFVGNWKLTKLSSVISGTPIEMTPELAGTQMSISALADGSFSMTTTDAAGTRTSTGTWGTANNKLTLKFSDGTSATYDYSFSGNVMTIKGYPYSHPTFGNITLTLDFTKQ